MKSTKKAQRTKKSIANAKSIDKKIMVVLNNKFEIISQLDIDESFSSSGKKIKVNLSPVSNMIIINLKKLKISYHKLSKKIPDNWLPKAHKYNYLFCQYNVDKKTVEIAMAANLKPKNDQTWCGIEQLVSDGEFFL
jgi:hypothetical protein